MPNLKERFNQISLSSDYIKVSIEGLGEVGLRKMTVADQNAWVEAGKSGGIVLIQRTVCDPETGELSLKDLSVEELLNIPVSIADALLKEIILHNNLNNKQKEEGVELKNSEANLN